MSKQSSLFQKFAEKFSFSDERELINTLKATAFKVKDGEVTDAQMMALLIVADQYGLNPFTKEIFAYPDKQNGIVPVVSVDGWSRIINQHPDMDGLEFIYDENIVTEADAKPCPASIECVIYRKGRAHPVRIKEFLDETYRSTFKGVKNGQPFEIKTPWQSHTKRMLRHKALIQCSRIAFGFTGIYDQDEAERIIEGQAERIIEEVQSEASVKAKQMLPRLINRATREGSWQAALEYVGEQFSGFDLDFMKHGLNAAKVAAEVTQLPADANAKPGPARQASAPNADPNAKPASAQQSSAPKTDVAQNTDSASDSGKQAQGQNATVNRQRKTPLSETRATLA
ncbi:phage recombination protein Bet [Methylobacter luteus]